MTITGPGVNDLTISGAGDYVIFSVAGGTTVSISGMSIDDGNAGTAYGGGIQNSGSLTISDCNLSGDSAEAGGAISNGYSTSTLTVLNCTFNDDSSTKYGGGAIENFGTMQVVDSTFDGNTACTNGGAIESSAGTITVDGGTIADNTAGNGDGGGINVAVGIAIVQNSCTIENNVANGSGGGISTEIATTTIANSNISDNSAFSNGGGIDSGGGDVTVENSCTIDNNVAGHSTVGDGGGIYVLAGTFTVQNSCTLDNNVADRSGGGIDTDDATITVANSTISENSAGNSIQGANYGGGIHSNGGNFSLIGSLVENNSLTGNSARGGGIDCSGGQMLISQSMVNSNSNNVDAGKLEDDYAGGIYVGGGSTVTVQYSTISDNYNPWGFDGGIKDGYVGVVPGTLTILSCTISGNSAGNGAGALGASNDTTDPVTIIDSTISGNCGGFNNPGSGGGGAGAIYVDGDGVTLTVFNCTFSGNLSTAPGATIAVQHDSITEPMNGNNTPATATFTNCTIADNTSAQVATINDDGSVDLINDIVAGNTELGASKSHDFQLNTTYTDPANTVSGSYDFVGNGNGQLASLTNSQVGTGSVPLNPMVATLANNGGPTQTMALQSGSQGHRR